jgi:hypothetical protein
MCADTRTLAHSHTRTLAHSHTRTLAHSGTRTHTRTSPGRTHDCTSSGHPTLDVALPLFSGRVVMQLVTAGLSST